MKSRSEFGKLYQKRNILGKGVEIGVQRGHNLISISADWKGSIIGVDLFEDESIYQQALKNTSGLKVDLIKGSSLDIASITPDNSLDWVYIDANHTYKSVMDDLKAWYQKVRKGGIVSGHDYLDGNLDGYLGDYIFGVKSAVDEFVKEINKKVNVTIDDTYDGYHFDSWWFVK